MTEAAPDVAPDVRRTQRLVLVIAILATFVSGLDGTIVNVALPAIMRELGGGLATQQWAVDAYLVTLGALILVAGAVSDTFGRITVLRAGLIGFGVASIAVAAAPTAEVLIAARAVQGIAGALLVPSSLALITSTFQGQEQGKAIGTWTGMTSIATLAGPVIGGLFVDFASWRWAFLVNVIPIGVTLWLLAVLHQRDVRVGGARIDYLGAVLCVVGLGGTVFALIEQQQLGWAHPAVWASLAVGLASLAGFLARQLAAANPILPLGMFRVRNFAVGNVSTALIYGALALNSFVIGVYLQQGAGWPATLAGVALLPVTLIMILLSSRVGALSGRLGPRLFMTVGPTLMAGGAAWMLWVSDPFSYWWQMLPGIILFGFGLTLMVSPLTSAILGAIGSERSGIASATNNAVARVAGLIAVALLGPITGGALDLAGFHRAIVVTAALLLVGGVVSWIGIRNPQV